MSALNPKRLLIDCDPGLDDAIALALAARAPEIEIFAITTAAGNAEIDRVTDNALSLAASFGLKCPIYAGAAAPMRLKPHYATQIWGGDGSLPLKRPRRGALTQLAIEFLEELLENAPIASITACLIAPMTNLGSLLARKPELAAKFDRLFIMGGALGAGNASRAAELNIWFAPHAPRHVLQANIPATILPLDITRELIPTPQQLARLDQSSHPIAQLCARLLNDASLGDPDAIHDAAVIAFLLWPELFSYEIGTMRVIATDGPARGQTSFTPGPGPHQLIKGVEREPMLDKLIWRLAAEPAR